MLDNNASANAECPQGKGAAVSDVGLADSISDIRIVCCWLSGGEGGGVTLL